LLKITRKGIWQCITVTKVGMCNKHGFNFDIQIVRDTGKRTRQMSPRLQLHKYPQLLLFPHKGEIPPDVAAWANNNGLLVVRKGCNSNSNRFAFVAIKDGSAYQLCLYDTCIQSAYLHYDDNSGFANGKWEQEESSLDVFVGDQTVSLPKNTDVDYG